MTIKKIILCIIAIMAIFSIFRPNMGFQLNDFSVAIESPDKAPEQINENPAMIRKESTIITKN